ncbi:hypothetical protein F2Q68_00022950 [Brassica cretica]|uniref:Clp1 P-loop domain-containing protein n=1 Tax=Brassica cretica TaxID=69181 RepID=A0A8S9FPT8_BRACR|nr:hypothetical protein F2Q68_00022950 [Brassica cretica]
MAVGNSRFMSRRRLQIAGNPISCTSGCKMSESETKPLIIPKDWSDAASSVSCSSLQRPVALVCGPKDSGKSTFSRNLVKVLLQRYKRVAYLDIDVGQPEFTLPGFLSLTVVDRSILAKFRENEKLKTISSRLRHQLPTSRSEYDAIPK